MNKKTTSPTIPELLKLEEKFANIQAIPVPRAARIMHLGRSTLYRKLQSGSKEFECVPHGRARWVSVRSICEYLKDNYRPSLFFDIWKELDNEP